MEERCSVAMVEKCGATLDDSHHSLLIVRSIELPFFTTHQKHTVFSVSSELVQVAAPGYYIMNLTRDIFSLSLLDNNFPRSLSPRQMVLVTSLLSYIHHSPPLFSTLRLPTHVPKSFSSFARFTQVFFNHQLRILYHWQPFCNLLTTGLLLISHQWADVLDDVLRVRGRRMKGQTLRDPLLFQQSMRNIKRKGSQI